MYQEHLYQELARLVAEKGDFGIASSLEGKLSPHSVPTEKAGVGEVEKPDAKEEER